MECAIVKRLCFRKLGQYIESEDYIGSFRGCQFGDEWVTEDEACELVFGTILVRLSCEEYDERTESFVW